MSKTRKKRPASALRKDVAPGWICHTLIVLGLAAGLALPAAADELAWIRQPEGCQAPQPTGDIFTTFECGELGRFTFSDSADLLDAPSGACLATQEGVEEPEKYATIQTLPPISLGQPLTPCDGPGCFATQIPESDPWIAVIDWDDWHGVSVAWMIESLSGVTPVLFDLGSGAPAGHTSDVHVLRQLCRVVDHNDARPDRAPVAVNMSFGRVAEMPGYGDCSIDMERPPLSCMLVEALERLGESTKALAAAGNHDTLLFPAISEHVQAVGGLDVAWFNHSGQAGASWQTPDEVMSLMPASSICLEDRHGELWAAPPGTSWASAILTGWVAAVRPDDKHWLAGNWRPVPVGDGYMLASAQGLVPSSRRGEIDGLLDRLEGEACSSGGEMDIGVETLAAVPAGSLEAVPIILLDRESTQPTPDPDPCLPCMGGWDDGPGGGGLFALEGTDLLVDFRDSPGVPADLELVGMRIIRNRGALLFELLPESGTAQNFYDKIEASEVKQLRILGLQEATLPGDELSLVYLFRQASSSSAESKFESVEQPLYWSSTTVQVRDQLTFSE